jgi:hypothetical protein
VCLLVVVTAPAWADVVWLRSGQKAEGIWQGVSGGSVEVLFMDRTRQQYPIDSVKSVCFVNGVSESVAMAYSPQDEVVLTSGRVVPGIFDRASASTIYFTGPDRTRQSYGIDEVQCLRFRDPRTASEAGREDDELRLRSGETVRGRLAGAEEDVVRFTDEDGRTQEYPMTDVASISIGEPARAQSTGLLTPATETTARAANAYGTIPSETTLTVRLIDAVNVDTTAVGEFFDASVDEAVEVNGRVVIPKGADAVVQVVEAEQSGRLRGQALLSLRLASVTVDGQRYDTSTEYATLTGSGETKDTAVKAGGGAAIGAIIGAIAGGGKGAAIGAAVGGGAGTVVAAQSRDKLELPSETRLDFMLNAPLAID